MTRIEKLAMAMVEYERGDSGQVQHFLNVHSFCRLIGAGEGVDEATMYVLEAAGLVHDIGIRAAKETYGMQNGKLQEEMGPPIAEKMMAELGFEEDVIRRVAWLVSRHHTYTDVEGLDYRILLEADYLVNRYEFQAAGREMYADMDLVMRTETGRSLCRTMFALD